MIFDSETNILYWEVAKGKISHATEFGNFIIHLSAKGKPILIEILEASNFIKQFKNIKEVNSNLQSIAAINNQ